jgi:DNA-binding NarL/FixJ family response regulator
VQEGAAVIPVLRLAAQQGRCGPAAAHVLSLLGVSNIARRLLLPETGIVLSPREVDVLELLAANANNRAIAERLDVDMITVKSHVTRVLAKLGVRTRHEAAELARALGLGNGW